MGTFLYRVDPRMIVPVIAAMVFGSFLVILEGLTQRGVLLILILLPFFYLGFEILARKITVDSRGILISKFLRSVFVEWSQIESLDAIKSGSKLFLILQTVHTRPVLITNTISPFTDLVDQLLTSLPAEAVSSSARELLSGPPSKVGPLVQAWIVCLVMVGLVVGKLLGYA